jgi:acyl-CoA synthetase (AMP-forming)/AMP-acid ligase II
MPTIGGTALSNASRIGARQALVTPSKQWTWHELNDEIGHAAAGLQAMGLRKGDRLAMLAGNGAEFIIGSHAAARLGVIVVPVSVRLAVPEVAHILADSGAAMLAFTEAQAELAERSAASLPTVALVAL